MSTLVAALKAMHPDKARVVLDEIDSWCRTQLIAITLLPTLILAVTDKDEEEEQRTDLSQKALLYELARLHEKLLEQFGTEKPFALSPSQFSKYINNEAPAPRKPLNTLFLIWLSDQLAAKKFDRTSRVCALLSIFNFSDAVKRFILQDRALPILPPATQTTPLLSGDAKEPTALEQRIAENESIVSQALVDLLGLEHIASPRLTRLFFSDNPAKACFVVYRHSMQEDSIIKGLLVIQAPKTQTRDAYSFAHFYRDDSDNFRATHGFVLTVSNRHYFLGATGKAQHQSRDHPRPPRERPHFAEGIKLLVIDSNQRAVGDQIWGGLFLSHDSQYRPIAGRCVLIRSKFEWHDQVQIDAIPAKDLRSDIAQYCDISPKALEANFHRVESAMDNSYEPTKPHARSRELAGPLTLVSGMPNAPKPKSPTGSGTAKKASRRRK